MTMMDPLVMPLTLSPSLSVIPKESFQEGRLRNLGRLSLETICLGFLATLGMTDDCPHPRFFAEFILRNEGLRMTSCAKLSIPLLNGQGSLLLLGEPCPLLR